MFQRARLKLTLWYLFIIILVSVFFSLAFYQASAREMNQIINRIKMDQQRQLSDERFKSFGPVGPPISIAELQQGKIRIIVSLLVIDSFIWIAAGAAGYFLAGKTLAPIKMMVDEQNQFIADTSHELRTPIATLRAEMESSLLQKQITDREARQLIKSNLADLNDLQSLVIRLLEINQLHTGQEKQSLTANSLTDLINTAQKKVASLAKRKKIEFQLNISEAIIPGNHQQLIEVLVIILDNAIKYSPTASQIAITTQKKSNQVIISIQDQGWGISPTDLPHIFERFYRADKSRSEIDGYGLGLAIAQKIIFAHHGSIKVTCEPKNGSTFFIELPVKN